MNRAKAAIHEIRCQECRVTWISWAQRIVGIPAGMTPKTPRTVVEREVRDVPFIGGQVNGRIYKDDGFGGRVVVPTYSDNPDFNNPEPSPGRLVHGLYLYKDDTLVWTGEWT